MKKTLGALLLLSLVGLASCDEPSNIPKKSRTPEFKADLKMSIANEEDQYRELSSDKDSQVSIRSQLLLEWHDAASVELISTCTDKNSNVAKSFSIKMSKPRILPVSVLLRAEDLQPGTSYACNLSLKALGEKNQIDKRDWKNVNLQVDFDSFNALLLDNEGAEPELIGIENIATNKLVFAPSMSGQKINLICDGEQTEIAVDDIKDRPLASIFKPALEAAKNPNLISCQFESQMSGHILARSKKIKLRTSMTELKVEPILGKGQIDVVTPQSYGNPDLVLGWRITNSSRSKLHFLIEADDQGLQVAADFEANCWRRDDFLARDNSDKSRDGFYLYVHPTAIEPKAHVLMSDGKISDKSQLLEYSQSRILVEIPPASVVLVGFSRQQLRSLGTEALASEYRSYALNYIIYARRSGHDINMTYFQPEFSSEGVHWQAREDQTPSLHAHIVAGSTDNCPR